MKLVVSVMGGLCSRMRAVCAARLYCRAWGMGLAVHWPEREHHIEHWGGFSASLEDLFDIDVELNDGGEVPRWPKQITFSEPANAYLIRTCNPGDFMLPRFEWIGGEFLSLKRSQLVKDVMAETDIPHPIIGVQVRDWLKQPMSTAVSWHVARLRELTKRYGKFAIFLACDSKTVSCMVHDSFPGRVLETRRTYDYDRMGIVRSCADLFTLQKCDWVLGANASSASQMVAFMRGAKYEGPHTSPNGIVGGRYEDAYNFPFEDELEIAMGEHGA